MSPFQIRLIEEKIALAAKLVVLRDYIAGSVLVSESGYRTLPFTEQLRLRRQYSAMQDYSSILGERIAAFVPQNDLTGPTAPPVQSRDEVVDWTGQTFTAPGRIPNSCKTSASMRALIASI